MFSGISGKSVRAVSLGVVALVAGACGTGRVGDAEAAPQVETASAAATACDLQIFPRVGNAAASTITPQGPGLIMMGGGTDVDAAFVWMHDTLTGSASVTGGDIIVLRATGTNAYDAYIAGLAKFNSVRTILLPTCGVTSSTLSTVASYVNAAQGVFFAGGNQADYVGWKNSTLSTAVQNLYNRGGVVGGTSAGNAIQGQFVFDSIAANAANASVATADATFNPYESIISFTRNMYSFAGLQKTVVDPHFITRDRLGRLAVFMARQLVDGYSPGTVYGIGIDEASALLVDKTGQATLRIQPGVTQGGGGVLMVRGGPLGTGDTVDSSHYFRWNMSGLLSTLSVQRLNTNGQRFNLTNWCGDGSRFWLAVDGSATNKYSPRDPYFSIPSDATTNACP